VDNRAKLLTALAVTLIATSCMGQTTELPQYRPLFNGKDLSGWVNVNTADDTWSVRDGMIVCKGHPIGVMRTDRQYENFLLHIEWRHMEAGGNSGVFLWSEGTVPEGRRLPKGMETQMLELDWVNLHKRADGAASPWSTAAKARASGTCTMWSRSTARSSWRSMASLSTVSASHR